MLDTRRDKVNECLSCLLLCHCVLYPAKIHEVPSDEATELIVQRVALKWRLVGQELGADPAELDQIASECGSDQSCCSKLFRKWSAREITASCPFTWKGVIETLDSEFVRESSLARSLESTIA